jgi:NAD(P)-dependent dehydrogenase (short-subunit alcohol dehydrogenase family)
MMETLSDKIALITGASREIGKATSMTTHTIMTEIVVWPCAEAFQTLAFEVIAIGEVLVEIMRPVVGLPLDLVGIFQGPFVSGAPAIFVAAAARLGARVGFVGQVGMGAFGRLLLERSTIQ